MSAFALLLIAFGLVLLLNILLLIWLWRLSRHYNSLIKGANSQTLMQVLEGIQKTLSSHERVLSTHNKTLAVLGEQGKSHLLSPHVKRFNPFSDTGGDQSFILALLDGNKDGVMITSLHSRENTRFYIKEIKGGKGQGHTLSAEEQKML